MTNDPPYEFLLAIDGSPHADRAAAYVVRRAAGLRPCEVHIVNVLALRLADLLTRQQQDLVLEAGTETAEARRMLAAAGIAYRFHTEQGNPADRIVELINTNSIDEVVVGSRGMSALDNLSLGSVAYKIVHLAPIPVTVVPNPRAASELGLNDGEVIHRVLLSVDGSAPSARAVAYVCALRDARIPVQAQLLNVQIPILAGNVRRFVTQEMIDAYCRAEGEEALGEAKKSLQSAGIDFDAHILIGHAGETISRQAVIWRCTRIVMGTRGHGALGNIIVGSTALQVMHQSEIPVTLVK